MPWKASQCRSRSKAMTISSLKGSDLLKNKMTEEGLLLLQLQELLGRVVGSEDKLTPLLLISSLPSGLRKTCSHLSIRSC